MNLKYHSSLQRTMIVYFLLIGFASSLVGVEFIYDTHRPELHQELVDNFAKMSKGQVSSKDALKPIRMLRNKAMAMVAMILIVVIIVLTMFIKNITEPLQQMIDTSKEIARGDLSRTVTIATGNELSELGNTINDLTTNMQEMILLSEEVCSSGTGFLQELTWQLDSGHITGGDASQLRTVMAAHDSRIRLLAEIIQDIQLFRIDRG
jgi:methyl-accepting chemotaxis protein